MTKISDDLRKWCDETDVDGGACDGLRVLADRIDAEMAWSADAERMVTR